MKHHLETFQQYKCDKCGKEFYIHCAAPEYAYKLHFGKSRREYMYCSYKCFRLSEKERDKLIETMKEKRRKQKDE